MFRTFNFAIGETAIQDGIESRMNHMRVPTYAQLSRSP